MNVFRTTKPPSNQEATLASISADSRIHKLLTHMLRITAVSLLLANLLFLLRAELTITDLLITALYVLLLVIGFRLLKDNHLHLLAHGITAVLWISISLFLLVNGAYRIPGLGAYVVAILMSLLLIQGRATIIYFLITLITGISLFVATRSGQLPVADFPLDDPTVLIREMPQAFLIFVLLGGTYLSLRYMEETLRINEHVLEEVRQTLGQRTKTLSATNEHLLHEIGERQQAETNLEQQRAFLREIIDTIPNFISVKNEDGRYLIVNKALAQVYNTAPAKMEGKKLSDFHQNKGEVSKFDEGDRQVLNTQEEVFWPEMPFIDADGHHRWLQVVKRPLFDPTTGATTVLGVTTDKTLEKTVTEALREKEENFRTLVQASFDGIVICTNHIIQESNANFATMFGYSAVSEVLGKNALLFLASENVETLQETLKQTPRLIMEAVGIRQNKSTFPVEIVTHTINYQGKQAQITGYRDITTRKQAEEAEQHAQKLESLSLMAGGLAHDFNNLLVAMMSQIAIAKTKINNDHAGQSNLDKAVQATETAALLTRQLLAYTGQGHFEISSVHLNQLINQNLQLFKDALPTNISFQTELHTPLPHILADSAQIQQIIMNLLLNAAEALGTEPGTISVKTTPYQLSQRLLPHWQQHNPDIATGDFVQLEVTDTGRGMSEETLSRIFDPFFSTKGTGRGLGLAAAMGIMRGHNGSIRAISKIGKGTTFQFLFPSSTLVTENGESTAVSLKPAQQDTVLIIDDERQVREAIGDILDLEEIPTLAAASGKEGIDQFTTHQDKIGLIILDLSMPGMDGIEAFGTLRQIDPNVKIVLSSGYTEAEILEKMAGTRPTGFLQKPYRLEKVLHIVAKFLN